MNTELVFKFITKAIISSYYKGKSFSRSEQLTFFMKGNAVPKATKLYKNSNTFVSPIFTSSLAGNINLYKPSQSTNWEKFLNYIIYKEKMPTLVGNKYLSDHFFLHGPRLFLLSIEKIRNQSVRNGN